MTDVDVAMRVPVRPVSRWRRPEPDFAAAEAYRPAGGPEAAAFFDFDHTLLHGDAAVIFGRTIAKWSYEQGLRMEGRERAAYYAWLSRRLGSLLAKEAAYRTLQKLRIMKRSRVVELAYRAMEGFPASQLSENLDRVWQDVLKRRLYPQMLRIMEKHRALGQRNVIVTTSLREIVEYARRYVGSDVDVIACEAEAKDGVWTGRVEGPLYGAHKAAAIRDWATRHGVDLARSYAYSDHYSDLHFLRAVGHPVAVNPKTRLRRLAEREGWTVLDLPPPPQEPVETSR